MTKKISLNDWTTIGAYNHAAKWLRPLCSYTLTKTGDNFRRDCNIGWPLYLILFLPVHLLQLFVNIWDGGLKEFEIQGRHLGHDYITEHGNNCGRYAVTKEIWERA
jgi:hypothetical protein